ncbi:MAG: hypothetical protein ACXVGQ_13485, partial [Mycobacteriaceae bacterium]
MGIGTWPRLGEVGLSDGRIVCYEPGHITGSGERNASGADRCVLMLDDQVEPNPRGDDENPEREEQQVAGLLESFTLGIYHFVWYSKLNHEQRAIGVGKGDPVLTGSRPAKSVTALVLGSLFCWLILPMIAIFVS